MNTHGTVRAGEREADERAKKKRIAPHEQFS